MIGKIDKIGYSNLHIGDQWAAANIDELKRYNITHILNVTPITIPVINGIIYERVPMLDDVSQILMIDESFNFLKGINGNVLVHCQAGRSRSAAILIAYIMYKDKISYEESYNIIKKYRPMIELNSGFVKQLNNFIQFQI